MRAMSLVIPALLMAAASPCGLQAQPLFDAPYRWFPSYAPVYAVAASPRWHRTGAFVVATHTDQMSVEVFTAEPNGDLGSSAIIPVPSHPHGVAIADFDGDDCPDVAVGGYDPPGIVLIHGRCAGKFDPPAFLPVATSVEGLAVADIDADGQLDLVGWSSEGGVVLLSDRAGGFQAPIPMPGSYRDPIAVGCIDADPYPDIGVGGLTIRYGRGDGTFGGERSFALNGEYPSFADLDGDGHLDVVCGVNDGYYHYFFHVLVNDGSGGLNPPVCRTSVHLPGEAPGVPSLATSASLRLPGVFTGGDVDGDGHQDVIMLATSRGGPVLSPLLGNGCGGFREALARTVQSDAPGVLGDVDGDGRDDFLQPDGAGVSVFTGSASGCLGPAPLRSNYNWLGLIAARVDDGPTLDLVVTNHDHDTKEIEFGLGGGEFRLGSEVDMYGDIAIADLDLDGHSDIVTNSGVSLGDGQGAFMGRQQWSIAGVLGVMRAEGDPYPEVLFLRPDSLLVLRNRGDTVYEPSRAWSGGGSQLLVCDLNADGRDDAIISTGNNLSVRLGGPGGLGDALPGIVTLGGAIQAADLDGDGRLDVFAGNAVGSPSWLRGHGDGRFDAPAAIALPPAQSYVLADWNGDGTLDAAFLANGDFLLSGAWSRKIGIVFGTGGASFSAPTWFGTGYHPVQLVAGDLTGDGRPDLAVKDSYEGPYGDLTGWIDLLINRIPAGTPLGVGGAPISRSATFALGIPSPNPLRGETRFHFSPGAATRVDVRVLDIAGRDVRVLLHGDARAGDQEVVWDGRDAGGRNVPPGIYLVSARDKSTSITRRVVVLH